MKNILYLSILFLFACGNKKNPEIKPNNDTIDSNQTVEVINDTISDDNNPDSILLEFAGYITKCIKDRNIQMLAAYIHPKEGVRFSPYAYVDTTTNIKMSPDEFKKNWDKTNTSKKINWGPYSAGEEEIVMTIEEYFKKFIYNLDYLEMSKPVLNKTQFSGTMPSNVTEVYKDCDYVEYYIPGVNKQYEGLDWGALQLVFKQFEGYHYLVGIIHAEWTT